MHEYSFEKLRVWQRSREFVKQVYLLTRKFPDNKGLELYHNYKEHPYPYHQILQRDHRENPGKIKGI